MNIKNYQLESLHKVLIYPMIFSKSRIRNKFLDTVVDAIKTKEKSRIEIIEGLCKKDKDKEPILEDNRYAFTPVNLEKFNKEFTILQNEEVELPMNGDIVQMIEGSTAIMDDSIGETKIVEEILEEHKATKVPKK